MSSRFGSRTFAQFTAIAASALFLAPMLFSRVHAAKHGEPLLHRKIDIPLELQRVFTNRAGKTVRFGGDIRLGDLNNDGQADLLVLRSVDGGMKPSFLGAFTQEGESLWRIGAKGDQPNRPGPVAIHDLDGDGRTEVVCLFVDGSRRRHWQSLENVVLQIRDGATGTIERQESHKTIQEHGKPGPPRAKQTNWNDPNWVHQRILIANFRGNPAPRDFVIKFGLKVLAFDDNLKLLWSYNIPRKWEKYGRHTAYIPTVGDIDHDGKDEVLGGYYLLDHDGKPLWEKQLGPHMDSVAIVPWDEGRIRAICSGGGHVLDHQGATILKLGDKLARHGQEVRVANFDAASPGPEMFLRNNGHTTGVLLISNRGKVLRRFNLNEAPNNTGMEVVFWNGPDQPALLANAGELWNAGGESTGPLPGLPMPRLPVAKKETPGWRMPWHHTIPANLCGDDREELLLYNPWDTAVYIYTPAPLDPSAYDRYRPTARQYNARLMD